MSAVLLLLLLPVLGCRRTLPESQIEGSFGVLYGGQIQRLQEVQWQSEKPPQLGFRIDVPASERGVVHDVRWELVRPGPEGRRVTLTREFQLEAERARLDQVVEIPPEAPLGTVNLRVLVDRQLVIDRALVLRRR
jgi:hypothetical protein